LEEESPPPPELAPEAPAPAVIQDSSTEVVALEAAVLLIRSSNGEAVTQEAGQAPTAVIQEPTPSNSMEILEVIPSNSMEILEEFLEHLQLTVLEDLYLLEPANLEQLSISQDMELTETVSQDLAAVMVLLDLVALLAIKSQDGDLMWPLVAWEQLEASLPAPWQTNTSILSPLGSAASRSPSLAIREDMEQSGGGTNFAGAGAAAHMYKPKKGISKKMLGLGVAAGFVGGAALGVAGTMASYSVMHRYQSYKNMMRMRGFGYGDYDDDWNNSYRRNECMFGCPFNSHCEWGYCECNYGFIRSYGQCQRRGARVTPRAANFDPFQPCNSWADCQAIDMNMMCNTNLTVQAGGKCQCKPDMKWNEATGECQMFLDVDCSSITYETPPSKLILDAVKKAEAKNIQPEEINTDSEVPDLKTPSPEQALNASLLAQIDTQVATANEMKEAFCRDVDSFSLNFDVDPERPPKCQPVPQNACGIVYDSSRCNGGWKLIITQGQITFPYFSSYWKYRNDIDLIGVQAGCTLTAFSDTNYQGRKGTFKAPDSSEFWWDLSEYAEFQHLDQDIESMQCVCTREPVGPANTNP